MTTRGAALLFGLVLLGNGAQQRGVVSGIKAAPASARTETDVTVTVTGANPCGAVNVDWGDGTAITYAIYSLPTSQKHAYQKPGSLAIVARGMGNCDGDARTAVEITAPPAAPAPPEKAGNGPIVTNVTFTPQPAVAGRPVAIAVDGRGACAFTVDYGDGNKQEFSGTLPRKVTHAYGAAGSYVVILRPEAPCTGRFTERLEVARRGGGATVTDMRVTPSPGNVREAVTITILGSGPCSYNIDFGDENSESRTRRLPDAVSHTYTAADTYTITVSGVQGCGGYLRRSLTIF